MPKPTSGLHLPPDRFCITACNYKLAKAVKKKPGPGPVAGNYFPNPNTYGAPKIIVAPPGSTLIPSGPANFGPVKGMLPLPGKSNVSVPMPKFQIQTGLPGQAGPAPMFSINLNPSGQIQGMGGIKRKASDGSDMH